MIRLNFVLLYLAMIAMASCTATTGKPSTGTPQLPRPEASDCGGDCLTTSAQVPTPTSSPVILPSPSCEDSQFAISKQVIAKGKRISVYQMDDPDPWSLLPGGLSVHLDVISATISYADPVLLRLTITNDDNQPLSFARPQQIVLRDGAALPPNSLIVKLVSPSGDRIRSSYANHAITPYFAPPINAFSTLTPGSSCTIEFTIDWKDIYLAAPFSPGSYYMTAFLYLADPGPRMEEGSSEIVDIESWIGRTDESDPVTFTVLTSNQQMP